MAHVDLQRGRYGFAIDGRRQGAPIAADHLAHRLAQVHADHSVHDFSRRVGSPVDAILSPRPVGQGRTRTSNAYARYSTSETCSPHVVSGTSWSSERVSHIARWVMKWLGAAPCQCHSPGGV